MRALANLHRSPSKFDLSVLRENAAARHRAAPPSSAARALAPSQPDVSPIEAIPAFAETPAETEAWWLSRSQEATFTRRRIELPDTCARALRAKGHAPGRIVVEFNGATFSGAVLAANEGRDELDPGDALAQEMADVLDEDDGLTVELLAGRGQPTLALHPFIRAMR